MQGIIKTWFGERGFGWIRVASGREYFVHIQNWEDVIPPSVGMTVQFEVGPGHKQYREQALNVRQYFISVLDAGAEALAGKIGA